MRTLLSRVPPRSWPPWMSLVSAKLQVGPWWGGGPGCPSSARPGVVPVFGDRSSRGVCERAGGSSARAGSPRGRGIALRPVLGPRGRGPAPRIRRRQRELGSQDSSSCFPGVRSQRSCHLGRNRARSLKLPISSLPSWFTRDSRAACAARTASAANPSSSETRPAISSARRRSCPGSAIGRRKVLRGSGAATGRAGWRELVARVGRADRSPHVPAAAHRELGEHEPARVAADLWPGGLPVVGRRLG